MTRRRKQKNKGLARDQLDKPIPCTMPSYREHYTADGTPKRSYNTMEAANYARKKVWQYLKEVVEPYRCSICGKYHIGHRQKIVYSEEEEHLRKKIDVQNIVINNIGKELQSLTAKAANLQERLDELKKSQALNYCELQDLH